MNSLSTSALEQRMRAFHVTAGIRKPASVSAFDNYDFGAALRFAISGRQDSADGGVAAFVDEEFRRAGHTPSSPNSVFIPAAAMARTLQPYQANVTGSGAELVETQIRPELFIDTLRAYSPVLSMGAQIIDGLKDNQQISRQASTSATYWVTTSGSSPVVSGAITESEATFDAAPLIAKPCQIASLATASRLEMIQGGALFNSTFTNDIRRGIATAVDLAALQGTGASGQPTGVINTGGVGAASGASFSYATSIAAVGTVANANGVVNKASLGWVTTPTVAALLAQRAKATGYPQYVWDGNPVSGLVNNHRAESTNNMPAGTAIFGDFSQILILSWSDAPLEIEVNSFSSGDVQIRAMMSCNVVIRHPQSFTVVSGIT